MSPLCPKCQEYPRALSTKPSRQSAYESYCYHCEKAENRKRSAKRDAIRRYERQLLKV